jgi:hypothetical protein
MIRLPFGFGELTPSAERVRRRTREAGTGIPDMLAPSAYREVEPSAELLEAAEPLYTALDAARAKKDLPNGDNGSPAAQHADKERAQQIADDESRQIISIDI